MSTLSKPTSDDIGFVTASHRHLTRTINRRLGSRVAPGHVEFQWGHAPTDLRSRLFGSRRTQASLLDLSYSGIGLIVMPDEAHAQGRVVPIVLDGEPGKVRVRRVDDAPFTNQMRLGAEFVAPSERLQTVIAHLVATAAPWAR